MAPEIIENTYDEKCDIWSIGISAIEMAMGEPPYASLPPVQTFLALHQNKPPSLPASHTDPHGRVFKWTNEFRDFVKCCLVKDPKQRPTSV
jgi:serine/threonine-protein kinase 24/25/MST4